MTAIWQYPKISRRAFLAGVMAYSAFPAIEVKARTLKEDTPALVRGPYLQRCHENGIVVMWYTDIPSISHVRFGTSLGELDQSFTIEGMRRRHVARINNLPPATKYYYSVGTHDELLSGGDAETFFYTAPPIGRSKSTRVWVLGDSGYVNNNSIAVRDSYYTYSANKHTDLCLMLGDNAYQSGTEDEYQNAVFDMYSSRLRQTPLWPAYGNHDARCVDCVSAEQVGPFFDLFKTPRAGESGGIASTRRDFYSFDYGDAHFICLNSHDGFDSHMFRWLHQDLSQCRATWRIAYWHHPPYSKSIHDSDTIEQMRSMRAEFLPLLESYGVDLVLTGHNHCYERSVFINGHYGVADTLTDKMILDAGNGSPTGDGSYTKRVGRFPGTVYVAAGCASTLKHGPLNHPIMAVSSSVLGSLAIDIESNTIDVRFLDRNGDIHDEFQIHKTQSVYFPVQLD